MNNTPTLSRTASVDLLTVTQVADLAKMVAVHTSTHSPASAEWIICLDKR